MSGPEFDLSSDGSMVASSDDLHVVYYWSKSNSRWMQSKGAQNAQPNDVMAAPKTPGRFYLAAGGAGLLRSDDGGKTWHPIAKQHASYVTGDLTNSNRIEFVTYNNIWYGPFPIVAIADASNEMDPAQQQALLDHIRTGGVLLVWADHADDLNDSWLMPYLPVTVIGHRRATSIGSDSHGILVALLEDTNLTEAVAKPQSESAGIKIGWHDGNYVRLASRPLGLGTVIFSCVSPAEMDPQNTTARAAWASILPADLTTAAAPQMSTGSDRAALSQLLGRSAPPIALPAAVAGGYLLWVVAVQFGFRGTRRPVAHGLVLGSALLLYSWPAGGLLTLSLLLAATVFCAIVGLVCSAFSTATARATIVAYIVVIAVVAPLKGFHTYAAKWWHYRSRCNLYIYKRADDKGQTWTRYRLDNRIEHHDGAKPIDLGNGRIGILSHGSFRPIEAFALPEGSRVHLRVVEQEPIQAPPVPMIHAPRLAHPQDAADFVMDVREVGDAALSNMTAGTASWGEM